MTRKNYNCTSISFSHLLYYCYHTFSLYMYSKPHTNLLLLFCYLINCIVKILKIEKLSFIFIHMFILSGVLISLCKSKFTSSIISLLPKELTINISCSVSSLVIHLPIFCLSDMCISFLAFIFKRYFQRTWKSRLKKRVLADPE